MFISGPKNWIFTHYIYVVFIDKPHYIMKISLTPEWVKNAQATAIPYCYVIGTHNGRWISDKMMIYSSYWSEQNLKKIWEGR